MSTIPVSYIMSSGGQTRTSDPGGMKVSAKLGQIEVGFRMRHPGMVWNSGNIDVPIDQWFHFTATWNQDGNLTTYINGSRINSVSGTAYSPIGYVPSAMHLGKPKNAHTAFAKVFIDEWYFWDVVLTDEQVKSIQQIYFAGSLDCSTFKQHRQFENCLLCIIVVSTKKEVMYFE